MTGQKMEEIAISMKDYRNNLFYDLVDTLRFSSNACRLFAV